ncbi:MAG: hypothetical protein J6U97_05170 [Bacteroidaceae bacterium]|nr:hypothetical protein [Bacteroidaceae bacterium]
MCYTGNAFLIGKGIAFLFQFLYLRLEIIPDMEHDAITVKAISDPFLEHVTDPGFACRKTQVQIKHDVGSSGDLADQYVRFH